MDKKNSYEEQLYGKVSELIALARRQVTTSVNITMVHTYFQIGRLIVQDEQHGEARAAYGKAVLTELSKQLTEKFDKGFSVDNLQNMRQFFLVYSNYEMASRNSEKEKALPFFEPGLPDWNHIHSDFPGHTTLN